MRATDFIKESRHGSIQDDVSAALPATFVIPELQNQDPYKQYRFGLALAYARGQAGQASTFSPKSPWGENQVIVCHSKEDEKLIDAALATIGLSSSSKKLINNVNSTEVADVNKVSPIANIKKNKYGV